MGEILMEIPTYKEVSFEKWKKVLEDIIEKQRNDLVRYLTVADSLDDDITLTYYAKEIVQLKHQLAANLELLKSGKKYKDESKFYLDEEGLPVMKYLGKELYKEYEKKVQEILRAYS